MFHGEVWFTANLADWLFGNPRYFIFVCGNNAVLFYELANLAIKFQLALDEFDAIASLMKASIAGIAVEDLVFVIALGAETNFAISFKKTF